MAKPSGEAEINDDQIATIIADQLSLAPGFSQVTESVGMIAQVIEDIENARSSDHRNLMEYLEKTTTLEMEKVIQTHCTSMSQEMTLVMANIHKRLDQNQPVSIDPGSTPDFHT